MPLCLPASLLLATALWMPSARASDAPAAAAPPVATPSPAQSAADFPPEAQALWAQMLGVQRLQARFSQVRSSTLLAAPLTSTGTLVFARPDRLRWSVQTPARSDFVMQGSTVGMLWPDLGVRQELDLSESPEAARVVHAMMTWLSGDLDSLLTEYRVQWLGGTPARVGLEPTGAGLAAVLQRAELEISGSPPVVRRILLVEPGGDRVEIQVDDVVLDGDMPADAFELPPL